MTLAGAPVRPLDSVGDGPPPGPLLGPPAGPRPRAAPLQPLWSVTVTRIAAAQAVFGGRGKISGGVKRMGKRRFWSVLAVPAAASALLGGIPAAAAAATPATTAAGGSAARAVAAVAGAGTAVAGAA